MYKFSADNWRGEIKGIKFMVDISDDGMDRGGLQSELSDLVARAVGGGSIDPAARCVLRSALCKYVGKEIMVGDQIFQIMIKTEYGTSPTSSEPLQIDQLVLVTPDSSGKVLQPLTPCTA